MNEITNERITFPQSHITIKLNKMIYNSSSKVYICNDFNNNSNTLCLKVLQSRSDDKISLGIINTEIILMVE